MASPRLLCIFLACSCLLAEAIFNWHPKGTAAFDAATNHYASENDLETMLLQQKFRDGQRTPIVMIPGFTSSNLTYELDNSNDPGLPQCPTTTSKPEQLWPFPAFQTADDLRCWLSNFMLFYVPSKGYFSPRPNETVNTLDMGTFAGTALWYLPYFYAPYGYKAGVDLFNVPFDWRYPLDGLSTTYAATKAIVELAYKRNNNRKVALMSVSWGPQVALGFLHRMTQEWKDTYIAWYVAESPLYAGSPVAVMSAVSGYAIDPSNPSSALLARAATITIAGTVNLFPRLGTTNTTWDNETTLVETPSRNYTAADYGRLYADMGFEEFGPGIQHVVEDADLAELKHPGVNTLITYGYNLSTAVAFHYADDFIPDNTKTPPLPMKVTTDPATGDGVVPVRSPLRAQEMWTAPMAEAGLELLFKKYANQQHGACLLPPPYGPDNCFTDVLKVIQPTD
eukprot:TRINITY_DN8709_c0_g1_i4.p1 TRINITY_DN8709_c0_g1~~TRINITY_DN8709_c0_g1_i4.p1  ORF type:complete len:452 (+),score=95.23 TRINITY_DN8709_c0_g1_i4:2-1357(+)